MALARPLQVQVVDQVPSEGRASRLLDVEEHDDVMAADVELEVVLGDLLEAGPRGGAPGPPQRRPQPVRLKVEGVDEAQGRRVAWR